LLLAIVLIVLLHIFLLRTLLGSLVAISFPGKLLLTAILLVPLGLLMGMPFPTALHALASQGNTIQAGPLEQSSIPATVSNTIEWAWAMNAAASVLGSVIAIVVSIHFGLNAALTCAAGAYLSAMALTLSWQKT
jgi:hypothetical protein